MRQWFARTEPQALEIISHLGGSLDELQRALAAVIARDGVAVSTATARSAIEMAITVTNRASAPAAIHIAMMRALGPVDVAETVRFGEACMPERPEPRNLHTLALHHRMAGNFERAIELLDQIGIDEAADADTALARSDLRVEATTELELRAIRATIEEDETAAREIVGRILTTSDDRRLSIVCRILARAASTADPRLRNLLVSCLEGTLASRSSISPDIAYELSSTYLKLGYLTKAKRMVERGGDDERCAAQRRTVDALLDLGTRGFCYVPPAGPSYVPLPDRVLCVLHSSLPHHSSGYATRSHGLLGGITRHAWKASGVTRLGYPQDLGAFQKVPLDPTSVIDQVTYHRLPRPGPLFNTIPKTEYLTEYADALCEIARRERPRILHAAADCHNGLAANAAARALGIKSIYEVRGLWEIPRGSREPDWMETEQFRLMTDLESQAAREADAVVVITRALGEEMVRRGVPADKITLVPNGVDIRRFVPRPRDGALATRLGLQGKRVIGYIGSIVDYEGLDLLMHAIHGLHQRDIRDVAALIVGDGIVLDSVKTLARELGIANHVVFTGRVPHHEVEAHYSLVDIAPFPRKSLPVTEMVSPLKPLEAMAMNKVVVASDVAALAEMIEPGVNGLTFRKDDIEDLTAVLARVLSDPARRPTAPREWVETHRSWYALSGIVDGLYKRLIGTAQ